MKKIFFLLLGICSMLVISFSCGDNSAKIELKKRVAAINKRCPEKYDDFTCVGVKIQDGNMVEEFVYDDEQLNLDYLKDESESGKRLAGSTFLSADEDLSGLLLRSGYGYTANYKCIKTGAITTFHLSNEEIKGIKENPASKNELLDWQIQITNSTLPQQFEIGSMLVSVECQGNIVSYIFEIDEDLVDMSLLDDYLDEAKEDFRQELEQEWASPTSLVKQFTSLVCRTNKSLRYVYRGKTTGKELTIEFTNAELRNISHDYIEEE